MTWREDRADAYDIGEILGIFPSEVDQAHDIYGHTWAEIAEQLGNQYERYYGYQSGEDIPEFDFDEDEWPEWAVYYHGSTAD